jgi:hypothetical protein
VRGQQIGVRQAGQVVPVTRDHFTTTSATSTR